MPFISIKAVAVIEGKVVRPSTTSQKKASEKFAAGIGILKFLGFPSSFAEVEPFDSSSILK